MDNERTADVLQVALASYDRKELRVQKNYLEEQNPVLACTCFLNGHKLLQELQQGHNFDIVVLCSQMEDMSSIEFMMELRKLEHKPLLMLFDEGRRKNSSALRMEDSGSCCCVERMELKNLLRELYRMPGQQWQRTEQQCQQLYHSWGIRLSFTRWICASCCSRWRPRPTWCVRSWESPWSWTTAAGRPAVCWLTGMMWSCCVCICCPTRCVPAARAAR